MLQTARLHGRAVTNADLAYVVEIDSDWQIQKTLFGTLSTAAESEARLARWVEMWTHHGLGFWLFTDGGGKAIGHGGLFPSRHNDDWIEVGYALKPAYWNLGYATEIASAALRIGFESLRLQKIVAVAHAKNIASRRVMEKCGLRFEEEFLYREQWPSVLYGADRESWLADKKHDAG